MFLHRIKLLTLAGFTVWVDASWLILAALLTWTLALGEFPHIAPNLSTATYWWMGLAGAVGLFISIVLHELTHALIARRYDMPIAGITLFIFGGVAELHKEPTSAKAEFLVAIGGPIASMVLGTVLLVVASAGPDVLSPAAFGVVSYLGDLNWILALFNLVPAFPLDGGRVLRAGLWGWMDDFARATRIAAGAGEFFGIAMILYGILEFVTGNAIAGVWLFFIGFFLHGAAGAARQDLALRRTFAGLPVSVLMQRNPIGVAPDLSIADLIEHYFYRYYFKAFPVLRDHELVGCIMANDVRNLPPGHAPLLAGNRHSSRPGGVGGAHQDARWPAQPSACRRRGTLARCLGTIRYAAIPFAQARARWEHPGFFAECIQDPGHIIYWFSGCSATLPSRSIAKDRCLRNRMADPEDSGGKLQQG